MTHDTEERNGTAYPTPGKWSLNWVEGDVVSWRYDDDGDRVFDGTTAHAFVSFTGMGRVEQLQVDVDGETVEVIDNPESRDVALRRIGDILADHAPD